METMARGRALDSMDRLQCNCPAVARDLADFERWSFSPNENDLFSACTLAKMPVPDLLVMCLIQIWQQPSGLVFAGPQIVQSGLQAVNTAKAL